MKRKLDSDDVPATETLISQKAKTDTFESLGLDARLLQAVAREKFSKPTLVQARAIPEALAGKDILARAKTGSGKTAAYALPILQSILRDKTVSPNRKETDIHTYPLLSQRHLPNQSPPSFLSPLVSSQSKSTRQFHLSQCSAARMCVQSTSLKRSPMPSNIQCLPNCRTLLSPHPHELFRTSIRPHFLLPMSPI
jgi:hypothetical protein